MPVSVGATLEDLEKFYITVREPEVGLATNSTIAENATQPVISDYRSLSLTPQGYMDSKVTHEFQEKRGLSCYNIDYSK